MFTNNHAASVITAILPNSTNRAVLDGVLEPSGYAALTWHARGTLLKDNWLQRFLPPISPAKTMVQLLLPDEVTEPVMNRIVEAANLHKQATGAVFSQPCDGVFVGDEFPALHALKEAPPSRREHELSADLSLIVCIVDKARSDRIARAAVAAGAHGPVIYLCEGRGLRDRLGWLRITKQHEKDVLLVLCGLGDIDQVFQAMASAGELHLPGRGFMYRTDITKGLYNLPSLVSNRHYAANVQQIIHAIDHLTGHTHWRDGALRNVGAGASTVGLSMETSAFPMLRDQLCVSTVVRREQQPALIDLLLDHGIKGINFTFARFDNAAATAQLGGAKITDDYAVMNAVCARDVGMQVVAAIENHTGDAGITDLLVYVNPVRQVATYVYRPGQADNRAPQPA
ncbi:MAG: hypothetical protein AAFZ58_06150 [Pseudomonadota bacterium]